jgi:hypothetical protein
MFFQSAAKRITPRPRFWFARPGFWNGIHASVTILTFFAILLMPNFWN